MSINSSPFNSSAWRRHALLSCAQMRRAEEAAYESGVLSFDLMRRAGEGVGAIISQRWKPCRVLALCGPGNNGGDGFVAAEFLRRAGWNVTVAAMRAPKDLSGDAAIAAKNWQGKTVPLENASFEQIDLVIDALFGTGLSKPVEGAARTTLEKLVHTKIPVVAVDVPSGVEGDTGAILGIAPRAVVTVTFFRKKIGHLLLPGATLCGETIVTDIGIGDRTLDAIQPAAAENARELWLNLFPVPKPQDHKYTRGHALIAGGAVMTGATRLATRAAQRIGAGLVTLAASQDALPIYAAALESAIVRPADSLAAWHELLADEKRNVVLIGPGLGIGIAEADYVRAVLDTRKPCVLDADAFGNFATAPGELFAKLHPDCILTPHEGEFTKLFGACIDHNQDKLIRARQAAKIVNCIVLLKGADTVIAAPDGAAVINANAPPWLATAGAGDVLAGIILGLIAQHMPVFAAAVAATWIHGQAATTFGPGLIAEDLIAGIPDVLEGLSDSLKGV